MYKYDYLEENPDASKLNEEDAAFISSFFSYAFIGIMLDWIRGGMREKPEELVERIECVVGGSFERAIQRFLSLQSQHDVRNADRAARL